MPAPRSANSSMARRCAGGAAVLMACAGTGAAAADPDAPAPALVDVHTMVVSNGVPIPRFKVDAAWPKLPPDLMLGQVSGVAVDARDQVWLVHRPHTLEPTEVGVTLEPPIADCCRPAPTVVRFHQDGRYLGGWGAAASVPVIDGVSQWPASVHGIFVDQAGTVWIGGNGEGDHAVLNFTADGEFIRAIGQRERHQGNTDRRTLGRPADVHHDGARVLVADGYSNRRLIRFSSQDGSFDGYWGAYASVPKPIDTEQDGTRYDPSSRRFADIVHCVVASDAGLVYVCDRRNNRVQLWRQMDDGTMRFLRDIVISPGGGATGTATDVALSPDGRFVYVAEMVNSRIWILDGRTHEPLAAIGRIGRQAGQFTWLHSIDVDSDGNLYATEVSNGRRAQKLVLTGIR